MSTTGTQPIACTLSTRDYHQRLAWIRALRRDALMHSRRCHLTLELVYSVDAIDRVRELVRHEQTCCAFLTFVLEERSEGVHLTITAPERARDAADVLFEEFVDATPCPSSRGGTGETCCQ